VCMIIQEKYIDPFSDFGFKWIFGTEENKNLLISFLNDLLDIDDKIIDLEYRNLEKLGLNIVDRKAVFDVFCTDEKNNNFIVELQRTKQEYFKDRSIYYTSFPIQEKSKRGDWDYELKKIFFVGILEFNISENKGNDDYLTKVQLCNTKNNEVFYNKLTYYYLEMPKFKKKERELSNHLEYWLFMLNNMNDLTKIPQIFKDDKFLNQAFDVAEFLALSKEKQFSYQHDLKVRLDNKCTMDYAKKTARKEGIKEGIEKGIKEGKMRGVEEEKIEIATKALKKGLDTQTIATITGLSFEQIEFLIDKDKI